VESGAINSYRDLRVWQEAMALAQSCYHLTKDFPKEELFGMSAQIRRSSASIAANIAEGHGREQTRSFVQFLRIAQGSLKELETHLLLAERVTIVQSAKVGPLLQNCEVLGRMLRSYIRSLQRRQSHSPLTIHHSPDD
jgi:four helix bundle protein